MFCPKCGAGQKGELNFCKSCGANLQALRRIEEQGEKFDWSKTWVAEMFLSEAERKRRNEELERQRGITPEVKRYNEIKGGVITASVGLGVMVFLRFFFEGVVMSGQIPAGEVHIVSRIWLAGLIPFLIGLGIIFNGLFVSKKQVEAIRRETASEAALEGRRDDAHALRAAVTSEFVQPGFSVTDATTRHLSGTAPKN